MEHTKTNCIICKKEFDRRVKGMKDRKYKIPLRPYRSLTCSTRCAVLYNRMPLKKREFLKIQGGICNMEEFIPEVNLGEDFELTYFDDGNKEFGFMLQSEEKENPKEKKDSEFRYYHDVLEHRYFKERKNLELFKKGLKLIGDAIFDEEEIEEEARHSSLS